MSKSSIVITIEEEEDALYISVSTSNLNKMMLFTLAHNGYIGRLLVKDILENHKTKLEDK